MYWQILLLFLLLCYNLIARESVKSEWMLFPWQRNPWISPFDELIGWKTMNLLSSCYTFAFTVITWVCKVIESGLKESPTTQYIQSHTNDNKPTTTQIRSETPTFNSSKKQLFTCFDNESWILISSPNSTFSDSLASASSIVVSVLVSKSSALHRQLLLFCRLRQLSLEASSNLNMEQILQELVKESQQLEATYHDAQQEKGRTISTLEKEEDKVDLLKKKRQELMQKLNSITNENVIVKAKLNDKKNELTSLQKELATTSKEMTNLQAAVKTQAKQTLGWDMNEVTKDLFCL